MQARAPSLIAGISALRRFEVPSANLAIGAASVFVAAVAVLSLAIDRSDAGLGIAGGSWSLRGTLAPFDEPGSAGWSQRPLSLSESFTGLS